MSDPEVARAAWWVWFWDAVESWAFFGVVVTLAVEFAAHRFVQPHRATVERAREAESTQLRKDTAEANAKALAIELELARLKAPRIFATDKIPAFVEAMRPFAGQQFSGQIPAGNPQDASPLWDAISRGLTQAGWKRENPVLITTGDPPVGLTLTPHEGVVVWVPLKKQAATEHRGAALVDALNAAGIAARLDDSIDDRELPNVLVVEVGTKPQ